MLTSGSVPELDSFLDDDSQTEEEDEQMEGEEEKPDISLVPPKLDDVVDALNTVRNFFTCSIYVDDNVFDHINSLENSVFNTSLSLSK